MPLTAEDLAKKFKAFQRTVYFRVVTIVLLGVVVAAAFPFTFSGSAVGCLFFLAIPLAIFLIPYWSGERKTKNFLINVLPVFLISVLLVAAFQTNASTDGTPLILTSGDPAGTTNHLSLWNGTVDPYKALGPGTYTFNVRLHRVGINASAVHLQLNLTQIQGLTPVDFNYTMAVNASAANTVNDTWYTLNRTLDAGIYEFGYFATDGRGNASWTLAPLGPIAAPYGDYYFLWLYITSLYLIIPFSFYFIILFMYWYTGRMRRMRSRMIDLETKKKAVDEKEGEKAATPTQGKAAKAAAFTCTNCGADVDETDEKCPKCGATFEE